jgi:hypothetical protein
MDTPEQQYDLSAGIVPPPQQQPPSDQGDYDLSAGIVQQQQPQQPQQSYDPYQLMGTEEHWKADVAAGRNPNVEAAKRDWERVKGVTKGAAATGAGLIDLLNTDYYKGGNGQPFSGEDVPYVQKVKDFTNWVRSKSQASNPEQEIGQIIQAGLEMASIPEAGGEAKPLSLADKFSFGKDLAGFMEKYPFLRSLLNVGIDSAKTAARGGGEQYTQTYLKTEDPAQAEQAGTTGALWGGGAGAIGSTLGETAGAFRRGRPGANPIAGARFETQPGTKDLLLRNLKDVTQDPATQAVDEAFGNIARTGLVRSMNRTNATRAPEGEIIPPSRQLPGRSGFVVGAGAETTPTKEGEILQPARKKQIGTRVVEGKGSPTGTPEYRGTGFTGEEAPPPPREVAEPPTQRGSHRELINQYLTSARPGTETAVEGETGPAAMIFTDDGQGMSVERARQELAQRNAILNDEDAMGEMSLRQHNELTATRDDIAEQLRRFDDYAASQPHQPVLKPLEAARNTSSLGEAADHLKAAHGTFWTEADNAAKAAGDETFTSMRDEEKRLRKQIFGENPTGRLDELRGQLADVQQRMMDFFDKYRTKVDPAWWDEARKGYQDGIVMQNLDDFLQKKFGGITRAEEARGVGQRVFEPGSNFNQQLEDFYNSGFRDSETNREVLKRTIGQQHMDDLKKIGVLFDGAKRMEQSQGLARTILSTIRRHYHGVRGVLTTSEVGLLVAHQFGAGAGLAATPAITGGMAGTRIWLTNRLINDPEFMRQFTYAVEHHLPPRTAGPLLAARMIATMQNNPVKQKKQTAAAPEAQPEEP